MKVLIMSVTAGEGHNTTAKSIAASLEARGAETKVVDTYKEINPFLYKTISNGYLLGVSPFFSPVYSRLYALCERRRKNAYRRSLTRLTYSAIRKRISKIIRDFQPDVIIYTHVWCGVILDVIRQKEGLLAKTVGIVTDFVMHPYWEETLRSDYVILPNDLLIPAACLKGFRPEQLVPSGIPIKDSFADAMPKEDARRALGLDPDRATVLVMGGSMGYGNLAQSIKKLDKLSIDFQMIVICGNNKKAKAELDALETEKQLLVLGYTDKVGVCMDAANCIVSKPGGLTTSESLAKRLPMIICDPIPGQEERNTAFLVNNGAAVTVMKGYDLAMAVGQLFSYPNRINAMLECISNLRRPHAARDLCDFVMSLGTLEPPKAELTPADAPADAPAPEAE